MALTIDERREIRDAIDGHLQVLHRDIARSVGQAMNLAQSKFTPALSATFATVQDNGADTLNNTVDVIYDNDPTNTAVTVSVLGNASAGQRVMMLAIPGGGEYAMGLGVGGGGGGGGGTPSGALLGSVDNKVTAPTSLTTYGAATYWDVRRADGTSGSPTALSEEDVGAFRFWGHNGSAFSELGGMYSYTNVPFTSTTGHAGIKFNSIYDSTGANLLTVTEHMRITNGAVIVANTLRDIGEMTGSQAGVFFTCVSGSPVITIHSPTTGLDSDWVGRFVTQSIFSVGTWPFAALPFAPTILCVSEDGTQATLSANASVTSATGTLLAEVGSAVDVEGSTFRTKNIYMHHYDIGTGSANAWETTAFRIHVDHTWDSDPTGTPGWQSNTLQPGPQGLIQVDGTTQLGGNFNPLGGDVMGSILINSSRIWQNLGFESFVAGGFIDGLVTTDTFVAQGNASFTTYQVLQTVANEFFEAWGGSSIQVGSYIPYSTENNITSYAAAGLFGTGNRAEMGVHNTIWSTPPGVHGKPMVVNLTSGSNTVTATTGTFLVTDSGVGVSGPGIPPGTKLFYANSTTALMNAGATSTITGAAIEVGGYLDRVIGFDHGMGDADVGRVVPFCKMFNGGVTITAYTTGAYSTADTGAFNQDDVGAVLFGGHGGVGHVFIVAVGTDGPFGRTGSTLTINRAFVSDYTGTITFGQSWRNPPTTPRVNLAIRAAGGISLYPTTQFPTTQDQVIDFNYAPIFIQGNGNWRFNSPNITLPGFIDHAGTYRFMQAGNSSGSVHGYRSRATYKAEPGVNGISLGTINGILMDSTIEADGSTSITADYNGIWSTPNVVALNSGSITAGTVIGLRSDITVASGATVTLRKALYISDKIGIGTLTTQYGIHVDTLSGAVTNVGIQNENSLVQKGTATFGSSGQAVISAAGALTAASLFVQGTFYGLASTGVYTGTSYVNLGITGATAVYRWVGGTLGGAPASGTFLVGDWVTSVDGNFYVCTTGGTPGTWTAIGSISSNFTAKGDLLAGTGSSAFTNLAVGTNNYALVADSTQTTGLKYAPVLTLDGATNIVTGFNLSIGAGYAGPIVFEFGRLSHSGSSLGAVSSGDTLGSIQFFGQYDTTTNHTNAATNIQAVTTQAFTASHGGARLEFYVTPNNSVTRALGMVLDQDGTFGIGTNTTGTSNTFYVTAAGVLASGAATVTGTLTGTAQTVLASSALGTQTSSYDIVDVANATTITMNAASITLKGLLFAPTATWTTNPGAFGIGAIGVHLNATWQGGTGATDTFTGASWFGMRISDTIKSQDANSRTMSVYDALDLAPALSSGGTLIVSTLTNLNISGLTIPSGATVTTLNGIVIAAPSVTGTLTTFRGIDIAAVRNSANAPTSNVGIRNLSSLLQQGAFVGTPNTVTVTTNAGTVAVTAFTSNFTNSSAAAMTITLATSGATDGQISIVRVYDATNVQQNITWVNTENGEATPPATSNASTTHPKTVLFQFNSATSLWRCIIV
jgi:hypothetical protein